MTRNERAAISILNAYKEGYESAIEDYKQEPCDDAISREAVIKTLHDTIFQFFDVCGDDEETLMSDKDEFLLTINKAISNNIKALPSVTQKPIECDDAVINAICDYVAFRCLLP